MTRYIKFTEAHQRLIEEAHTAGVKEDQLRSFLVHQYMPLPWQLKFHAAAREADIEGGPVDIGVGGARGPGKSHACFAQVALDDCQREKWLKVLFLRQTGKSAEESFSDLIDSVLRNRAQYIYNTSRGTLRFPRTGAKIILGGFENEKDIDKYVGIQYDVIVVEERNQLTGEKILKLKGSLRSNKPGWRARMYSSFNPGNIGHADVKKTFVDPYFKQQQTTTRFFPSTYRDNPFLKKEYVEYLNSLPGTLGKAWREGNFDTFEGQYFAEWDPNVHVIQPFAIPPGVKRYRAYDHGHENPACMKWYFVDFDGHVICYRELYKRQQTIDELARQINALSYGESYDYSVADPSIFAKQGFVDSSGGQTIAEAFGRRGVVFLPASNRRVDGWSLMHQYLSHDDKHLPKLRYFSTCFDTIRTLPTLIHDEHHPEDLDTRGEDHSSDCDRYLLLSLHEQKTVKPKTEVEKRLDYMKQRAGMEPASPSVLNDFYQGNFYRNSRS